MIGKNIERFLIIFCLHFSAKTLIESERWGQKNQTGLLVSIWEKGFTLVVPV
jgi:hypothetical protein